MEDLEWKKLNGPEKVAVVLGMVFLGPWVIAVVVAIIAFILLAFYIFTGGLFEVFCGSFESVVDVVRSTDPQTWNAWWEAFSWGIEKYFWLTDSIPLSWRGIVFSCLMFWACCKLSDMDEKFNKKERRIS